MIFIWKQFIENLKVLSFLVSIAIYKALYKRFGGFAADIIAAIDQVTKNVTFETGTYMKQFFLCLTWLWMFSFEGG